MPEDREGIHYVSENEIAGGVSGARPGSIGSGDSGEMMDINETQEDKTFQNVWEYTNTEVINFRHMHAEHVTSILNVTCQHAKGPVTRELNLKSNFTKLSLEKGKMLPSIAGGASQNPFGGGI
jgi:hypothetical protein